MSPTCVSHQELGRQRVARLVVIAIIVAIGLVTIGWAFTDWHFNDLHAYQSAALRIRDDGQLYGGDVTPWTAYRYAPWFAYAFVPLSYLPWSLLVVTWTGFTLACSVLAVLPLIRDGRAEALALAAIFGPLLVAVSASGNVEAPMIALLVWTTGTRLGPIAIGVAASLKITPFLLCAMYVGRRQWGAALLAGMVASVLWAPVALFELAPVTFDSGGAAIAPWAWLVLGGAATLAALFVAHRYPRYGVLASAAAAYLATPRLYLYDSAILLVAGSPSTDEARLSAKLS